MSHLSVFMARRLEWKRDQARSTWFCYAAVSRELLIAEAVNQRKIHSIRFGMGFSLSYSLSTLLADMKHKFLHLGEETE
jgi:hypothetical protein